MSMANRQKFINPSFTVTLIFVLSSLRLRILTEARNLAENTNLNVHPKEIFILAGQSNMAGRGAVKYRNGKGYFNATLYTPVEDMPDPDRIFRLNAQLGWEVAKDPLHYDIDSLKTCGVGPGMSFANAIKGRVGHTIGLVPCAVGETSISMWQRGGVLYNNMTKRAKAAVQGGGEIRALLWYQGENDSFDMDKVNSYKAQMESLIQNIREDLNLPDLPIIQVAIATGGTNTCYTCIDNLRTIQKSINLPNVVTVDAKGLPNQGPGFDGIHLSKEGQVTMGQTLARAYLEHFVAPDLSN